VKKVREKTITHTNSQGERPSIHRSWEEERSRGLQPEQEKNKGKMARMGAKKKKSSRVEKKKPLPYYYRKQQKKKRASA